MGRLVPVLIAVVLAGGCSSRKAMVTPSPEPGPLVGGLQPAMTEAIAPAAKIPVVAAPGAPSGPVPAVESAPPVAAASAPKPSAVKSRAITRKSASKRTTENRRPAASRAPAYAGPVLVAPPRFDPAVSPPEPGIITRAGLFLLLLLLALVAGIAYWLKHRRPPPGSPRGSDGDVPRPPIIGPPPAIPPPVRGPPVGATA